MEEVISMSNLPSNKFLDPIFEKEDLDEGFKVIWFLKNVFFFSFEISGGSYTLLQNTASEIGHQNIRALNFVILLKCPNFLDRLTTREEPRRFSLK